MVLTSTQPELRPLELRLAQMLAFEYLGSREARVGSAEPALFRVCSSRIGSREKPAESLDFETLRYPLRIFLRRTQY